LKLKGEIRENGKMEVRVCLRERERGAGKKLRCKKRLKGRKRR
jgi:hypothetical protein